MDVSVLEDASSAMSGVMPAGMMVPSGMVMAGCIVPAGMVVPSGMVMAACIVSGVREAPVAGGVDGVFLAASTA